MAYRRWRLALEGRLRGLVVLWAPRDPARLQMSTYGGSCEAYKVSSFCKRVVLVELDDGMTKFADAVVLVHSDCVAC